MLIDSMCFLCDSMCTMWLLIENNTQLATIPGRGGHFHGAIEERSPCFYIQKTHPFCFPGFIKAYPIVLYEQDDLLAFVCHGKVHDRSLGIFENIVELFLHDPVNTEF